MYTEFFLVPRPKFITAIADSGLPEASSLVPSLVCLDAAKGFKGSFSALVIARGLGALHIANAPEVLQLLEEYALLTARQRKISSLELASTPLFGYFVAGFVSLAYTSFEDPPAQEVFDALPLLKKEIGLFSREAASLTDRLIETYVYPEKRARVVAAVDALADAGLSLLREENTNLYAAVGNLTTLLALSEKSKTGARRAAGLTYALLARP